MADPQLDAAHCAHYGITYDTLDMPEGAFLTAGAAWKAVRAGTQRAGDFGHGYARGAWFMAVNVMRDALAQADRVTSDWDRWRAAGPKTFIDANAADTDAVAHGCAAPPAPFWHRPLGARAPLA